MTSSLRISHGMNTHAVGTSTHELGSRKVEGYPPELPFPYKVRKKLTGRMIILQTTDCLLTSSVRSSGAVFSWSCWIAMYSSTSPPPLLISALLLPYCRALIRNWHGWTSAKNLFKRFSTAHVKRKVAVAIDDTSAPLCTQSISTQSAGHAADSSIKTTNRTKSPMHCFFKVAVAA